MPAEEQLLFEERQEQLIQEAKAKFLADFKVDRNNKVVRQRATMGDRYPLGPPEG